MMLPIVVGIDPGFGGALAIVNELGDCKTLDMPTMGKGKQRIVNGGAVARFLADHDVSFAIIELVGPMPRQGVSSMFRFGTSFGVLIGVLHAACIPHRFVTPAKWKKDMGLTAEKALSRRRAIERFPYAAAQFERAKDEGRAEAALLAAWWLKFGDQKDRSKAA